MTMPRSWRALGLSTWLMLASSSPWALGADATLDDLRQTAWTAREGAPSAATSLVQAMDGYLWLGGASGLYRFDAARFERVELPGEPELSSAPVYSLSAPRTGGLWIGYTLGGAAFFKDGRVTRYGASDGLPAASVTDFAQQPDGTTWIATTRGLGRLHGGRWEPAGPDWNLPVAVSYGLMVDSVGAVWITVDHALYRLRPGEHRFEKILTTPRTILYVVETPAGGVWVSDEQSVWRIDQHPASKHSWAPGRAPVIVDADGAIWAFVNRYVSDNPALVRIAHPDSARDAAPIVLQAQRDRLASLGGRDINSPGALALDHEGNVWLSGGSGPVRFSERNLRPAPLGGATFNGFLASIAADADGAVWISQFPPSQVDRIQGGQATRMPAVGDVRYVATLRSGATLLSTPTALWRWAHGQLEPVTPPPSADGDRVQALAEDGEGSIWASLARQGLFRFRNGQWTARGGLAALGDASAQVLADDRSGALWAGYRDSRVAVVTSGGVKFYGRDDGLRLGNVLALYGRRRFMWVGGDAGLALFDGRRFRMLASDEPAALQNISGIVETAAGDLWLNAAAGIVHIPESEIAWAIADPSHRLSTEIFDAREGLEGTSSRIFPLPTLVESTQGVLWALTSANAYSIDPRHVFRSPFPPVVSLQSFTADDRAQPTQGVVDLPPRTSRLHLTYEGLHLTAAEQVRYRYRLDGVDKDWRYVKDQRDASYMNLGPGSFRFHVQATIAGAAWNNAEAVLAFTIAPAFVQTWAFIALCVLAAALSIWFGVRLRVAQISRQLRIGLAARTGERERIARELHDTLLQGTQGLLLSVHAVAAQAHRGEQVGGALDRILATADGVVTESRDRIQDLRTTTHSASGLEASLQALESELRLDAGASFRLVVSGRERDLESTVADEAFRIAREALNNAFRHAAAHAIVVEIDYGDAAFRLRVADDGRGIDAASLAAGSRPGHWGLPGMRERAERICARLDVRSSPGAGTSLELSVAADEAYARQPGLQDALSQGVWRVVSSVRRIVRRR